MFKGVATTGCLIASVDDFKNGTLEIHKWNASYLHRYERYEVAKLCKVLQILAQSSLSLIILKESNKKESLGNFL